MAKKEDDNALTSARRKHMAELGRKGGAASVKQIGSEGFSELGKKGAMTSRSRQPRAGSSRKGKTDRE